MLWLWQILTVSQPESQFHELMGQKQSQINTAGSYTQLTKETILVHPAQVTKETVNGPHRTPNKKATWARQ